MVVNCEILFDQNLLGTFFAGQSVIGTAILKSDKPKDVNGILIKISGYAETRWRERKFGERRLYHGREDYISSITYLMGSAESTKSTIQPGEHRYTFSCHLPYNSPSSFEGIYGSIRYTVKVMLVRPWKFDQTYSRGFTVIQPMDLNLSGLQMRHPSNSENYKIFCCGPCKTEPLQLKLHIPQGGFVPGQVIPVTALIVNNTNIPVAEVNFSLVMLVRYYSQHPVQRKQVEAITVTKAKGESILRNCTRSLITELPVPATPPTCINFCSIIQIAYQIEVEAKMKGFHGKQLITMPVTIGTVPLWTPDLVQNQPMPTGSSRALENETVPETETPAELKEKLVNSETNSDEFGSADEGSIVEGSTASESSRREVTKANYATRQAPQRPTSLNPNIPPPSYEESVHTLRGDINENELHAFGPCDFAPLYPVYNIPSPTAPNATTPGAQENGSYVNRSFES